MTKKLLIDAHQPEETRVALLNHNRIEEFDYENSYQKQLKGNVYLARVTRVEPSLQAAFVEYGGNRQGFLAFSEIHPDYYRIPVEDREEIEAENAAETAEDAAAEDGEDTSEATEDGKPETLGGEDDVEQSRRSHKAFARRYKIQEVITRKQILLVQVVKEERGNKGAALTTYLSLAGRYCVLMPNANRGGGVSRKIANVADRKRLKAIVEDLDVPQGMAVIARTAGAKRTKTEIKRDYTYLTKLWNEIRERTLESEAPSLIHEEGSLVKKAIRDIYTNDIDEVLVEGEEAYKTAKAQMKMLIPSHAKKVVKYDEQPHLFQTYKIEEQLESIYSAEVVLKSGGYIVINQTEALVAVDVNSGKATKERNIEETALKTNLEAAEEVGRQLKLRDLSGLIVIDFIDMEENRNQNAVERRLKDAVRNDRARIQVGSISHFGLLEMSRQRLRPSLVETVSQTCPHCEGTGRIRSTQSSALQILRVIEQEAEKTKDSSLTVTVNDEIALYILNHKRETVADIEKTFGISIIIAADKSLMADGIIINGTVRQANNQAAPQQNQNNRKLQSQKRDASQQKENGQANNGQATNGQASNGDAPDGETQEGDEEKGEGKRRRRGRRGGRRRKKRNADTDVVADKAQQSDANEASDNNAASDATASDTSETEDGAAEKPNKRRRSRGGRGRNNKAAPAAVEQADAPAEDNASQNADEANAEAAEPADVKEKAEVKDKPAAKKKAAKKKAAKKKSAKAKAAPADDDAAASDEAVKPKAKKAAKGAKKKAGKKAAKKKAAPVDAAPADATAAPADARAPISSQPVDVVEVGSSEAPAKPKRGWWSRS